MDKVAKLIRPYLRRFMLQTHPDYFQLEPMKKRTNAASIQKLTEIFSASTEAPTAPSNSTQDQRSLQLQFFLKKQRQQMKKDEKIVGVFDSKDSEWSKTHTFFQLCQQAGIPILDADMESVQAMLQKVEEERQMSESKGRRVSLTEEFAKELYRQYSSKSVKKDIQQQQQWQPEDILNNELIMFGPTVNAKSTAKELCQRLPELLPDRWWGKMGVLIVSPAAEVKPTKGVIILRNNMTLEDMRKSIEEQIENI